MSTHVPTHGVLSEPFPPKSNTTHDRKGREGKGIGTTGEARIHRRLSEAAEPASMDGSLRSLQRGEVK